MKAKTLRADSLLPVTASIRGFAFVAQRVGKDGVGPFAFNGVRFAPGSLSLLPLLMFNHSPARRGKGRLFRLMNFKEMLGGTLAGMLIRRLRSNLFTSGPRNPR